MTSEGEKTKVKYSITGTMPSGELAPGYAAPEQVLQPDAKLGKFATTFYAQGEGEGDKGKVAVSITGTMPSGELAPGYAAPEQVLQPDAKLGKFATTFYGQH